MKGRPLGRSGKVAELLGLSPTWVRDNSANRQQFATRLKIRAEQARALAHRPAAFRASVIVMTPDAIIATQRSHFADPMFHTFYAGLEKIDHVQRS